MIEPTFAVFSEVLEDYEKNNKDLLELNKHLRTDANNLRLQKIKTQQTDKQLVRAVIHKIEFYLRLKNLNQAKKMLQELLYFEEIHSNLINNLHKAFACCVEKGQEIVNQFLKMLEDFYLIKGQSGIRHSWNPVIQRFLATN